MKKVILFLIWLLGTLSVSAQSELPADTLRGLPSTVKQYGDFLIDMGLFASSRPEAPKPDFKLYDASKDFNSIFRLNPNVTMTQGFSTALSPGFGWGIGGFGSSSQYLQVGSFKLKNGMQLNTYGEYDANGRKVRNLNAMPWEKNNFKGGFELKSGNGAFSIGIQVQQGRNYPY